MANILQIAILAALVALTCSASIDQEAKIQKVKGIQRAMEAGCYNGTILEGKQGLINTGMRWPGNTVIYAWDYSSKWSWDEANQILAGFQWIQDNTCVRFKQRTNEQSYVLIHNRYKGCNAQIGYLNQGWQSLNLERNDANGYGCVYPGPAAHEMMHTLGIDHEQNRPDRDNYIRVYLQNVQDGMQHNFKKNEETTTYNLPYDFDSIMHYPRNLFSKNGYDTMESIIPGKRVRDTVNYDYLTRKDIDLINIMYNCY